MSTRNAYLNRKLIPLSEVCTMERAKKGRRYPKGCTIIPLSAAGPELIRFLDENVEVDTRFAVVIPKTGVNDYYLYIAIRNAADKFFWQYQSGINLKYEILVKYFKIMFHEDRQTQDRIAREIRTIAEEKRAAEKELAFYRGVKRTMLSLRFP